MLAEWVKEIASLLPECMFHRVTGLYCPGCGGTRAVLAFLRGNFVASFCYHPLVPYTAVLCVYGILYFLFQKIRHKKTPLHHRKFWWLWGALILLFGNFIFKNAILIFFHISLL